MRCDSGLLFAMPIPILSGNRAGVHRIELRESHADKSSDLGEEE
jgi:hypothetical protein